MGTSKEDFFIRKLTATFIATVFISLVFIIMMLNQGFELEYNRGNEFIGWFFVYAMYSGGIILVYGNVVSICIEHLQRKKFQQKDWLYILILGVFGLGIGLVFQEMTAAIYGMIAALIYGVFDKWIYRRNKLGKKIKLFWIIPIAILALTWGYLELTSPPLPPFTKEDALTYFSSDDGILSDFPEVGEQWEGKIGDYHVIRETIIEETGEEVYIVTFTEHRTKDMETETSKILYKINRNGLIQMSSEGDREQ